MLYAEEYLLSTDQLVLKINKLEEKVYILERYTKQIDNDYFELYTNFKIYQTEIIKSQIEKIERLEEFEYNGILYNQYLVTLIGNTSYFYLNAHPNVKPPKVGDYISHKIEGDKIR